MLSIQHVMCLVLYKSSYIRKNKLVAACLYPDAVRAYTGRREYSHFEMNEERTDVSYMSFPSDLHEKKVEMKKRIYCTGHLANRISDYALGGDTDFQSFQEHNAHLEKTVKQGIGCHLIQDILYDKFIRENIDCSRKQEDLYVFDQKEMNGKELRELVEEISQYGIYLLAYLLYQQYLIVADQKWLEYHIKPILYDQYPSDLAEKTFSYMKINPEINQKIQKKDWSGMEDGPLTVQDYFDLYQDVVKSLHDMFRSLE